MKGKHLVLQLAAAIALVFLMSAPAFAQNTVYRADRISTLGTVTSITREGDIDRITLDHGAYTYYVPVATVGARDLTVGSTVRIDGLVSGDVVNADMIALPNEPAYARDPMYVSVPYGSSGWMTGTVRNVNRHLGYVTLREDASGHDYRVDVRHMDTQRPVNVWAIRPGDHIAVNGSWERHNLFDALRIEY